MLDLDSLKGFAVIYMFTCPSGKNYIGQSINFKNRFSKYMRNRDSVGKYFSNAISKYKGINNFKLTILEKFEILESVENIKDKLNELEIYYINKFDSFKNGYNLSAGGLGSFKREVSEETRKKLSESNKGKNKKPLIKVICSCCSNEFFLQSFNYKKRISQSVNKNLYCSKKCMSEAFKKQGYSQINNKTEISKELMIETFNKSKSLKDSSKKLNISYKTLKKYIQLLGLEKESKEINYNKCEDLSPITKEQAIRIKYGGEKSSSLVNEYGISIYSINRIRSGKSWKHI